MDAHEIATQYKEVESFFTEVLSRKGTRRRNSLFKFVARTIWNYGLRENLEIEEVIIRTYERAQACTSRGTLIKNPAGWSRTTCLNIVREYKRENQRNIRLAQKAQLEMENDLIEREILDLTSNRTGWSVELVAAWRHLSKDEKKILKLRVVEGKSWKEVAEEVNKPGGQTICVVTIRQQGHRAKIKLKDIYLSLKK